MFEFKLDEIIEELKEYFSERASKLLANFILKNDINILPIIAINTNNEYTSSIDVELLAEMYQEFNTNSFVKFLKENEDFEHENIIAEDEDLVICFVV